MKTLIRIFTVCLVFVSLTANAQNKYHIEKAQKMTEYVAENMSLDEEHSKIFHDAFLEKLVYQKENIKGKDLTKEEKQVVHKEANKALKIKLQEKFTKEEIQTIYSLMKEFNEKEKEAKNKG